MDACPICGGELVEGEGSTTIERRDTTGRAHRVVKVPYALEELRERLTALGWAIEVSPTSGPFYRGAGGRA